MAQVTNVFDKVNHFCKKIIKLISRLLELWWLYFRSYYLFVMENIFSLIRFLAR